MHKFNIAIILLSGILLLSNCNPREQQVKVKPQKKWNKPAVINYHFENTKEWFKKNITPKQQNIVLAVNRTDSSHLAKMDSILIPNDFSGDVEFFLSFPLSVPIIKDIKKIIFFSYPSQTFAAYEMGELVYAGPTNMGRKADPTPTGLYYTNWKAEESISTFNDEWNLKWNFNIENKLGIGFHQYELPGYPASHSCLRLQEKDARYLYDWAQQWILDKNENLVAKGTPVIVFGSYDFNGPQPWLQLVKNPQALDISVQSLEQITAPFIKEILAAQQQREQAELKE